MKKYLNSVLNPCVALVFLLACAHEGELEASPTFSIIDTKVYEDFEGYTLGSSIWGNNDIVAAAPHQSGVNSSSVAMQAHAESGASGRLAAWSGEYEVTFDSGNALFFSGWFNIGGTLGGARIQFSHTNTGGSAGLKAGGFGIVDVASRAFSLYTVESGVGSWRQSESFIANYNTWYEIALVIQMDEIDISKSRGYYFVRNITAGDSEFTLVEDLSGIDMSWYTSELNASNFSYFRVENFNRNGQVDNLAAGTAVLSIPEPASVITVLGGLLIGGILLRRVRSTVRS